MTTPFLLGDLARDEGLRLTAYPDPESPRGREIAKPLAKRCAGWKSLPGQPWTIGYGHTGPEVVEGLVWTLEEAAAALKADAAAAEAKLDRNLGWWRSLSAVRQDVLANMCFNMGWDNPRTPRLEGLSGFVRTLALIHSGNYGAAAEEMLRSAWAAEVGDRAKRLATQMRTGVRAIGRAA
jgi:lysozyme